MRAAKKLILKYWPLIPALVAYAAFAWHFSFYQDDAYISYRYIANYLNGDGLVFNIGERIEGYTNFGWIIYLLFYGVLGLGYIVVSKITGFILGLGVIILTYLIALKVFEEKVKWFAIAATTLVGANQSLAYWAPAGLETAAFAFCVLLSLYLYITRNHLLIVSIMFAVLLRPEGAMIAGLLIILEIIETRKLPIFTLRTVGLAFVLSLPYVFFKFFYYGSILPNPFYAKTGFDLNQLSNGAEYVWRFMGHYGFYAVGYFIPILYYRTLSDAAKSVWLFTFIYTLYILLIGGDVLKVHRFFLPLFGPCAILIILSLFKIVESKSRKTRNLLLATGIVPLLIMTYVLPKEFVETYNRVEIAFTTKMEFRAKALLKSDSTNFSVALPTIGIYGYELIGHDIIDMLGLTDSTIAKYSEEPIKGMKSTWKESKHNSKYLLERAPDYIVFSTGAKPSAPAEKALFLYPQFLDSYRAVAWFYVNRELGTYGILSTTFKRVRPITGEIVPTYPVAWVEYYKRGLEATIPGDFRTAFKYFEKAEQVSPKPVYPYVIYQLGYAMLQLREGEKAEKYFDRVLAQDSMVFEAHKEMYVAYATAGRTERAALHRRWLMKLVPWYVPRLDTLINRARLQIRR